MVAHASLTARRLGLTPPARSPDLMDVLELYAFVRPARFCAPSPTGLALALGLAEPKSAEEQAAALREAAGLLLRELAEPAYPEREAAYGLALTMQRAGWAWGARVVQALEAGGARARQHRSAGLDVWSRLTEWEDEAPRGEAGIGPGRQRKRAHPPGEAASRPRVWTRRGPASPTTPPRPPSPFRRATRRGAPRPAGRGGDRHGQDPGLSGARLPVGRAEPGGGVDIDLHPRAATSDRPREPFAVARSGRAQEEGGDPQGARELSVRPQSAGHGPGGPVGERRPDRSGVGGALGATYARRRHDGRGLSRLAAWPVRPAGGPCGGGGESGGSAGRVRPRRLPALPHLFRRKDHPGQPPRGPSHRQPCPGP